MSFLIPHIRKRRSVDNFPPKASMFISIPSPTLSSTDEEVSLLRDSLESPGIETILDKQAVDEVSTPFKVIATCSPLSSPSPGCSSSSAAANMPYLGPTGRCKKPKVDETAEMFKKTLAILNKSMAASSAPPLPPPPSPPSSIDINDPDVLIGKNVESCLKSITNMALKLKYRRKFRSVIQDCEEKAEGLKVSD
ncbi:hypothetical protein ACS0PU_010354 [Formica fusca]